MIFCLDIHIFIVQSEVLHLEKKIKKYTPSRTKTLFYITVFYLSLFEKKRNMS